MRYSGQGLSGKAASYLASLSASPYKGKSRLSRMSRNGFVSHNATIHHKNLVLGESVFIGDRVVIYQSPEGGAVSIGNGSHIHLDSIIETGSGGSISIGCNTHIQPRCQFSAYRGRITIGDDVQIAPYCAFYPYNHEISPSIPIKKQDFKTKGEIIIGDDALLGIGVTVLDGVKIGKSAVIGAGSVVSSDIPDYATAVGVPARVIEIRNKRPSCQ